MGGGELSQAAAVGSSSLPVPGHWAGMELAEEDVLPCAGGAGLSRGVVPVGHELLHPCEDRNTVGAAGLHPPALCSGESSWDPQELHEGQANLQEKPHQIYQG